MIPRYWLGTAAHLPEIPLFQTVALTVGVCAIADGPAVALYTSATNLYRRVIAAMVTSMAAFGEADRSDAGFEDAIFQVRMKRETR